MTTIKRNTITAAAAATLAASTLVASIAAAPANAQTIPDKFYSNSAGNVRCYIGVEDGKTYTKCVTELGRANQPECNPPNELIPSVSIEPNWKGTSCWNQGFGIEPTPLKPMQIRSHGSATVIPSFSGNLYVFDIAQMTLIRAGEKNAVLFSLR